MTNKKAAPKEQPSNQSPDYTADDWDFIANKVRDSLKEAGIAGIAGILKAQRAEEAYFILPNGQTTGRIFADHHQEAYKPVISVQEIKHLVRYIDCSAEEASI